MVIEGFGYEIHVSCLWLVSIIINTSRCIGMHVLFVCDCRCVFRATSHVVGPGAQTAPSRGVGESGTGWSENTPVRRTPRISPMTFPLGCGKGRFIWM